MKKDKKIIFQLDNALDTAIRDRAELEGLTVSEFVRGAVREALSREPWTPVFRPVTNLEFRYGGNTHEDYMERRV